FRAPTVEELFSNAFHAAVGTYDVGDRNLKAETNQGIDGVLRAQRGRVDAQLSGYYNRINDYITPTVTGLVDPAPGPASTAAGAPPCLDIPAPAYTLVNLSAGVTLARGALLHTLTLRADNLLDASYFDATSRIKTFARNPGRNLALVYRVQF